MLVLLNKLTNIKVYEDYGYYFILLNSKNPYL